MGGTSSCQAIIMYAENFWVRRKKPCRKSATEAEREEVMKEKQKVRGRKIKSGKLKNKTWETEK